MPVTFAAETDVNTGANVSSTVTSDPFDAPAGSLVIACVCANSSTTGNTAPTISNNGAAQTWTVRGLSIYTSVGQPGMTSIHSTVIGSARTGMTVTVTTGGSTSTTRRPSIKVYVLEDFDASSPFGVTTIPGVGTTTNNATINLTSTTSGSLLIAAASEWQKRGVPSSSDLTEEAFDQSGADGVSGLIGYKQLGAAGAQSFNLDGAGSSACAWSVVYVEIKPLAAAAPTVSAGADVTGHQVGAPFSRTATDSANGSTITARSWKIQAGPAGVGTTIGTAAALSWTPTVHGTYTLRYSATNGIGTTTDDMTIEVIKPVGVDFIPELTDGRVALELAWGADLTDLDGSSWTWTDVTEDVRLDDAISFSLGRKDEASNAQPANLKLRLDNAAASYSLGGHSPNWPNVRKGTPVRLTIDPADGGGRRTVFQGYADGFSPGWDTDNGKLPIADLSASGVIRRLSQGQDPVASALRRFHDNNSANLVEYWPLEEDGNATFAPSATGGKNARLATGTYVLPDFSTVTSGELKWGAYTDLPAAERAPSIAKGGGLTCPARPNLFGNQWSVSFSLKVRYGSGPTMRFRSDVPGGAEMYISWYTTQNVDVQSAVGIGTVSRFTFSQGDVYQFDNVWHHVVITVDNSSGSVWKLYLDGVLKGSWTGSAILGKPTYFDFISRFDDFLGDPGDKQDPFSVSHLAVWNGLYNSADQEKAAIAYLGESPITRLERLCGEEGVPIDITGTSTGAMGVQSVDGFIDLLRECEAVDQGILYDGVGPGLRYIAREQRENAAVTMTLGANELVTPLAPVDDDQRTRNRVTVSNGGSGQTKVQFEDTTGPLGTETIGVYSSSETLNVADPDDLLDYAAWAVHMGTVEGYRYPQLSMNMRAVPLLAADVLDLEPSKRVTVEDVGSILAAMPNENVDLLVEGVSMVLTPYHWTVKLNCSPFAPWVIATAASNTGDTDADLLRPDTDGSSLAANRSAGATTLSVATPSGPLWTTASDDFPLYLSVGGIKVRATACSGGTSPQTFTVDALPIDRPSGTPVSVWQPPALGL